jgi:hypothetical protein
VERSPKRDMYLWYGSAQRLDFARRKGKAGEIRERGRAGLHRDSCSDEQPRISLINISAFGLYADNISISLPEPLLCSTTSTSTSTSTSLSFAAAALSRARV